MFFDYLELINTFFTMFIMVFAIYFILIYQKREKIKERQERLRFTQNEIEKIERKLEQLGNKQLIGNNYKNSINKKYVENDYEYIILLQNTIFDFRKLCDGIIRDIYDEEYVRIYLSQSIKYFYELGIKQINVMHNEEIYSIELMLKRWKLA